MSYYKMKDIPVYERPRERFKSVGASNLSDRELLSILLKSGVSKKNASEVAMDILKEYDLKDFCDITLNEFKKFHGIGEVRAIELLASIELGKRIFLREREKLAILDTPSKIWKDSLYLFNGKRQELFYCYYFNCQQELIERKLIFMGTINQSTTHTREIFREAYKVSATSIVCLHNHPSGNVSPSDADKTFTERLMNTGFIQGIPVVDHIIVSEEKFYSFYEANQIRQLK